MINTSLDSSNWLGGELERVEKPDGEVRWTAELKYAKTTAKVTGEGGTHTEALEELLENLLDGHWEIWSDEV
jgi:hypothetical protein